MSSSTFQLLRSPLKEKVIFVFTFIFSNLRIDPKMDCVCITTCWLGPCRRFQRLKTGQRRRRKTDTTSSGSSRPTSTPPWSPHRTPKSYSCGTGSSWTSTPVHVGRVETELKLVDFFFFLCLKSSTFLHSNPFTSSPAVSWPASQDLRRGYAGVGVSDKSRSLPTDSELWKETTLENGS